MWCWAVQAQHFAYFGCRASSLVIDVNVSSPEAGKVKIIPLLKGGEIPGAEMLATILAACNDKRIRPLTDEVSVVAPTIVNYDITLTYYIESSNAARAAIIQAEVENAIDSFVLWQKSKLGRYVSVSELTKSIVDAGANREDRKSDV